MNLANNLSILRILLVPFFISALLYYTPDKDWLRLAGLAIFVVACITDAADGYVARKFNQLTVLGGYIDPIADKLLLLGGFLALSSIHSLPESMKIPVWVTTAVITRDVVIIAGSAVVFITTGSLKPEPLWVSKFTTVFQMITLVLFLSEAPEIVRNISCIATAALIVVSGVQYIRMGARLMQPAPGR